MSHHHNKFQQTETDAFWYLHLTPHEEEAIVRLVAHLKETDASDSPEYEDKYTLVRFLKARTFDQNKTFKMYKAAQKFRQEHQVELVFQQFTSMVGVFEPSRQATLQECWPHCFHKTDRFGRPVLYERSGLCDYPKLFQHMTYEEVLSYRVSLFERLQRVYLPACSKAAGKVVLTQTVVLDLKGLGFKHFNMYMKKMGQMVVSLDQDCYPEHLGQMIIINAPTIFTMFHALFKPMLDERTLKKILVLGANFREQLESVIAPENIPDFLGGTSPCTMGMDVGPWADAQREGNLNGVAGQMIEAEP